ncbi:hypothetical protein HMPREF0201_03273 [Cedecea davisae DSM 4568]|uniref:Uncharacterized protein n=1 Tax=Cedecea davisae DSM 4568 TaxID=566551 RepID=S3IRE7_9ENTR|nr:hypothetical protein HMPREF0201_03273 [Cedecea davisae DSM 4568]
MLSKEAKSYVRTCGKQFTCCSNVNPLTGIQNRHLTPPAHRFQLSEKSISRH